MRTHAPHSAPSRPLCHVYTPYSTPPLPTAQALNQLAATVISLVIALVGGALTGLLVKTMGTRFKLGITDTHFFVDAAYWSATEGYSVYDKPSQAGAKYGLPSAEGDVSKYSLSNSTKVAPITPSP